MAEVTRDEVKLSTFAGEPVDARAAHGRVGSCHGPEGRLSSHFLLKEIHEQPQAIIDTMRGRLLQEQADVSLDELANAPWLAEARRITLVACGTAWHACLVGKYFLEQIARIPSEVDYGSEFRYRDPVVEPGTVLIVVSQSGETADTLAAVEAARERGAKVLAICNVVDSSIARRADAVIYTHAGPEISRRQHQGVHDPADRLLSPRALPGAPPRPDRSRRRARRSSPISSTCRRGSRRRCNASGRSRRSPRSTATPRASSSSAAASTTRSRSKVRSS